MYPHTNILAYIQLNSCDSRSFFIFKSIAASWAFISIHTIKSLNSNHVTRRKIIIIFSLTDPENNFKDQNINNFQLNRLIQKYSRFIWKGKEEWNKSIKRNNGKFILQYYFPQCALNVDPAGKTTNNICSFICIRSNTLNCKQICNQEFDSYHKPKKIKRKPSSTNEQIDPDIRENSFICYLPWQ